MWSWTSSGKLAIQVKAKVVMSETASETGGEHILSVPTAKFEFSRRRRTIFLILGILFSVGGGALLFLGLFNPESMPTARSRGQALIIGGLGFSAGCFLLFNALSNGGLSAETGTEGLVLATKHGSESCRWSEITRVCDIRVMPSGGDNSAYFLALARGDNRLLLVDCADGRSLTVTNLLHDLDRLIEIVQQVTLPRLLSEALAEVESKGSLAFGPLTVSPRSLAVMKDDISWEELSDIKADRGILELYKHGKKKPWQSIAITEIPNSHVLTAIIEGRRR